MKMKSIKRLQTKKVNSLMSTYYCSSFFLTIRYTLVCSRLIGLLPLSGLWKTNNSELRLNWTSPYTALYIISFSGQCLMFVMSFYWLLQKGISLGNITNSLFYSSSLISTILLLSIAKLWPELTAKVEAIEVTLPPLKRNIARYCNVTMVCIFVAATVEHLLSAYYGIVVAHSCDELNTAKTFFLFSMPWIFDYTEYALWKGILGEIFSVQSTFLWSFFDLLIANISIYLTEHFKLHYDLLNKAIKQNHFSAAEFRVQYLNIVRLVKLINRQIGIYILNSFGSNLYWICTQLFYSLNKTRTGHFVTCKNNNVRSLHSLEHTVYFTFSFSFIVVRTLLVLILAARIHSHSVRPLIKLYGLSTEKYDVEVERFISQINNIKVALSGLDFFYVTKTMILTLLGTIVTYELVLLQFGMFPCFGCHIFTYIINYGY